ncbi:MAG: thioesterase [Proteobacteria bacterium ST_bin13]|nr:MAG: thioesterase [Proteobacteria bacterium ST_bin13]
MNLVKEIAAGLSGLKTLKALIAAGRRPPIAQTLDFDPTDVGEGIGYLHRHAGPCRHGSYAATLLDSSCGCAVHSKLSATQAYTTLELKVAYHKAITANTETLRPEGHVVSFSRRAAFAEASLKDDAGRLHATATSTLLVMERS